MMMVMALVVAKLGFDDSILAEDSYSDKDDIDDKDDCDDEIY